MKSSGTPRAIGIILVVVCGIAAMIAGVYVSGQGGYLWSIILVGFMANSVKTTHATYKWQPFVLGLVEALLTLLVLGVVLYVRDANYLWGMLLIAFITDQFV